MTDKIKKNDIVKVEAEGKVGRLIDIQYAFDRYQLNNVSGWQYGIDGLSKVEIDSLITTIESLQSKNGQYETTVASQQEAFKDQGKEILRYRRELESQKEEIAKLKELLKRETGFAKQYQDACAEYSRREKEWEVRVKQEGIQIESLQKDIERYNQALKPSVVYSAIRHYYKQGLFESDEYGDIENVMDLISRVQEGEKP